MWRSLKDGCVGGGCLSSGLVLLRARWRSSNGKCWELACHTPKSSPSRSQITTTSHSCLMGWSASCHIPKQQGKVGRKITKTFICFPVLNCTVTTVTAMSERVIRLKGGLVILFPLTETLSLPRVFFLCTDLLKVLLSMHQYCWAIFFLLFFHAPGFRSTQL